jgi:hypothetical protein
MRKARSEFSVPKTDPGLFTEFLWEGGSVTEIFGWPHRYESLVAHKDVLSLYAKGYCEGHELAVKPKPGQYAVLFEYQDREWWNHFTEKEFFEIFGTYHAN